MQEYCNGGNVAKAIKTRFFRTDAGTVHLQHVLQVAWEMAAALQYIHSKQIIHGARASPPLPLSTAHESRYQQRLE